MVEASSENMDALEERNVTDLIKEFMAQDKKRELEYVKVLQEQISILKKEIERYDSVIYEQMLIIKQLTSKSNSRDTVSVATPACPMQMDLPADLPVNLFTNNSYGGYGVHDDCNVNSAPRSTSSRNDSDNFGVNVNNGVISGKQV